MEVFLNVYLVLYRHHLIIIDSLLKPNFTITQPSFVTDMISVSLHVVLFSVFTINKLGQIFISLQCIGWSIGSVVVKAPCYKPKGCGFET
jgi:hypothetical protein